MPLPDFHENALHFTADHNGFHLDSHLPLFGLGRWDHFFFENPNGFLILFEESENF